MSSLARRRERERNLRGSESEEDRGRRLARDRARKRDRLASETAEERETRLSRRRARLENDVYSRLHAGSDSNDSSSHGSIMCRYITQPLMRTHIDGY